MILFVCTGNTCRSPMAEVLLRHHLAGRAPIDVASAGTIGWNGYPATPHAVAVMAERGIDLGAHVSHKMNRDDVARSDVIVVMTRKHAWAVQAHEAEAAHRTFLLGELTRLSRAHPRADQPVRAWAESLGRTRRPEMPIGHARDEIHDPVGEAIEVYRATATLLDGLLARLTVALTS